MQNECSDIPRRGDSLCTNIKGCPEGRRPFGLMGHFQRCGAMRKENALIGYAFCKKARARSGRWVGDGAAVMSVSRGSR